MKKRKAKEGERILYIRATLSDLYEKASGKPHRTLAVPETSMLYSLASAIIESFDFDFDHAFGFYNNVKKWTDSTEGYELFADVGEESKFKGVRQAKANQIFYDIGKKWLFLFDYGDDWHFIIELERIEQAENDKRYPLVIESVGDAPPQYEEYDESDA